MEQRENSFAHRRVKEVADATILRGTNRENLVQRGYGGKGTAVTLDLALCLERRTKREQTD